MKNIYLLTHTSLFLILTAFTCEKNIESAARIQEQENPDPVCETEGELKKDVKGNMAWSEAVNDWVLWVNLDNPEHLESGIRYIECNGFPKELKQRGIEIICDLETKIYPNPGAIRLAAHAMELRKYKIINVPDNNR